MLERIRGIAGVGGAVETLILPLAGGNWNNRIWMDGSDPSRARVVMRNMIGPGYFHTFSTPLVAGREFDDRDLTASAARVAIVNEQFARQFGLGAAAVGRRFSIESTPLEPSASYEIVGVAGNTKYRDLREQDLPIVYVPLWQSALRRPSGQFIIRSTVGRDSLAASLRQTFDGLGKVRYSVRSYDAVVEDALVRERLMATMAGPFGTLALVLAVLGLYGVLSYLVTRQTREIGIRIALGASRRDVIAPILREAGLVVFIGLAAGVLLTVAGSRAAQSLLFGVRPSDPALLIVACAVLAAVAAVAAYLPARRAASVDPIVALRQE
jgi:predicted permease